MAGIALKNVYKSYDGKEYQVENLSLEIKPGSFVCLLVPVYGDLFTAARGKGAFLNGERLHVSTVADLSLARVDFDFDGPENRSSFIASSAALLKKAGQVRSYSASVAGFCGVAAGE
jgi:fructose-1,6-bisphosphatase/inositol monophosphatase family enzyme